MRIEFRTAKGVCEMFSDNHDLSKFIKLTSSEKQLIICLERNASKHVQKVAAY